MPKNIYSNSELHDVLNDINLSISTKANKVKIYCEDARAVSFLQYILSEFLRFNLDLFMEFIDINLGWTNYVQLAEKSVPEFRNNIIVLDGDVPHSLEYRSKQHVITEAGNFLFLPLVIEKDIFTLLKDHSAFARFEATYSRTPSFNYDICFNH